MRPGNACASTPAACGGFSLVELMVGTAIGLIVVAGASMVAVRQIQEHRRLMLETQVQQDLRAAADLLLQEMRRAGSRGLAPSGAWEPANPYAPLTRTEGAGHLTLQYRYARGESNTSDTPSNNEFFGIKWEKSRHMLYLQLGLRNGEPNWQPITDPDTVQILDFDIRVLPQSLSLGEFCDTPCTAGSDCPQQEVRRVEFRIRARARHDGNVLRTLSGVERIRADAVTGACPS